MKRRRFIVTGISVAAAGLALGSDACSGGGGGGGSLPPHSLPSQAPPPPGVHVHELTAQYAVTTIKGYKLRTRTYGGRTLGPPIETRPGKMLAVRIVNRLPQNRPARVPQGSVPVPAVRDSMQAMNARFRGPTKPSRAIDRMNNPHGFNTTNLHVHGIQTIPHIFSPLGTSDPSAPMLTIDPGNEFPLQIPGPGRSTQRTALVSPAQTRLDRRTAQRRHGRRDRRAGSDRRRAGDLRRARDLSHRAVTERQSEHDPARSVRTGVRCVRAAVEGRLLVRHAIHDADGQRRRHLLDSQRRVGIGARVHAARCAGVSGCPR